MARAQDLWDDVRSSWWFVPLIMAVGALLLAFVTTLLDARFSDVFAAGFGLYAGDAEGTRSVLETIATSLITVAGVAFSVAIVVMTLASSQFGPRVLRMFMRDPGNQVTLGTFVATFLFCLLVLRVVRSEGGIDDQFIPHLSVTVAMLLTIASLAVFIYFIHHSARSIQAAHIIGTIGGELESKAQEIFPAQLGSDAPDADVGPAAGRGAGRSIRSRHTGYVQLISARALLGAAEAHDLFVELVAAPGDFVVEGTPLARAVPEERIDHGTVDRIRGAFAIGAQRTDQQDISFTFDELQQMCLRALSPAVNDPITAIQCLDRMAAGLGRMARHNQPSPARAGKDGKPRVLARPITVADILQRSFSAIRRSARANPTASVRYLRAMSVVGSMAVRPGDLAAIRDECRRVIEEASMELSAEDLQLLRAEAREALAKIGPLTDQAPPVRP